MQAISRIEYIRLLILFLVARALAAMIFPKRIKSEKLQRKLHRAERVHPSNTMAYSGPMRKNK